MLPLFKMKFIICLLAFIGLIAAQFPPPREGVTVITSHINPNISVSFKNPHLCETTPGVNSWSGYVHLPPGTLDHYGQKQTAPINTFFWFFEARNDPSNAPLTLWMNGGPGASSMVGLLRGNGPCRVTHDGQDTTLNEWSWNEYSNMLYIDQPVLTGFSYDVLTNGTSVMVDSYPLIHPTDFSDGVPYEWDNYTHRAGTFGSQNVSSTVINSQQAAHAIWHFLQVWLEVFPEYEPNDNHVSFWTESYGGRWGPVMFDFFEKQNMAIVEGIMPPRSRILRLDTLGIINGYIDVVAQLPSWTEFLYKNTYNHPVINESVYNELMTNWSKPGGCREVGLQCQAGVDALDPLSGEAPSEALSDLCMGWFNDCTTTWNMFSDAGYSSYDLASGTYPAFPTPQFIGWLSRSEVLAALGVPVNFTMFNMVSNGAFEKSLDLVQGGTPQMGRLLDAGISIHLVYGDRDFDCNWFGGESISTQVNWTGQDRFVSAGYAEVYTEGGYSVAVGLSRQSGNLSFTQVFQSGHEVAAFQPEAAFNIFKRAMTHVDIATGRYSVSDSYQSFGTGDTHAQDKVLPERQNGTCFVLSIDTCDPKVWEQVVAGTVETQDYFVLEVGGE